VEGGFVKACDGNSEGLRVGKALDEKVGLRLGTEDARILLIVQP